MAKGTGEMHPGSVIGIDSLSADLRAIDNAVIRKGEQDHS
tara:strand:- start:9171 stop:9290 length:120 start_codon:yes stop_codon:yes gene_type:complete